MHDKRKLSIDRNRNTLNITHICVTLQLFSANSLMLFALTVNWVACVYLLLMDEKTGVVAIATSNINHGQAIEMKVPYDSSSQESTANANAVLLAGQDSLSDGGNSKDAMDMARLGKKQEFKVCWPCDRWKHYHIIIGLNEEHRSETRNRLTNENNRETLTS
jgi:triacylglycerol esterase/lipase EstA (alpha/beta hydrolase family)